MQLKYLFLAHYSDGTTYQQTPEDVSKQDPKRSCFYDIDHSKLTLLELQEQGGDKCFAVDLRNGGFYLNGVWGFLHDEQGVTFEQVIFARRHTHHFTAGLKEVNHQIAYVLGWRGKDSSGNPIQRVIELQV